MTDMEQAVADLAALIDRIPDSSHVTAPKETVRAVLAEHREMREQLTAFLDGAIPPYRPVSIPDMTDGDRIRALRTLLNTSIRLERVRRKRVRSLREQLDRARSYRLASPSQAVDPDVHTPERVAAYLAAHGWTRRPKERGLWDSVDGNDTVLAAPVVAADYVKRTGLLVSDLAAIYGTGELQVLADITETEVPDA